MVDSGYSLIIIIINGQYEGIKTNSTQPGVGCYGTFLHLDSNIGVHVDSHHVYVRHE